MDGCFHSKLPWKPLFLGGLGIIAGGWGCHKTNSVKEEWGEYLEKNQKFDVEKKYTSDNKRYNNAQKIRNIGGLMVIGGIVWWIYERNHNRKKEHNLSYKPDLILKQKIQIKIIDSINSIGVSFKF